MQYFSMQMSVIDPTIEAEDLDDLKRKVMRKIVTSLISVIAWIAAVLWGIGFVIGAFDLSAGSTKVTVIILVIALTLSNGMVFKKLQLWRKAYEGICLTEPSDEDPSS